MALKSSDYSTEGILGEGSFSRVFKLQHKLNGKQFAGKYLKRLFNGKHDIISCTEINVMKRIEDHPNILNLKDIICSDSFPCNVVLVFELMDMNLYEFLRDKQKPLSESISRKYFFQIICGIQHLHKNNIFHRDVKPENVLLKFPKSFSGLSQELRLATVKLADFGSVKSTDVEFPLTGYVATRWYRPPECVITDGYYGPKMDVWAAGCIFYEMLTLKPLFPGDSELDQLDKIHQILGSPNGSVLKRFRHLKTNFEFPKVDTIPFPKLLPNLSKLGVNILKACLNYLPETRIDSTRLLEHYYFKDVRHSIPNSARKCDYGQKNITIQSVSSPALMSSKKCSKKNHPSMGPLRLKQKRREESDSGNAEKTCAIPKKQRK